MEFKFNDGGRKANGYKGQTGDCAVRAIAIVSGKSYKEIYDEINLLGEQERIGRRKRTKSNARTGVYHATLRKYMMSIGFKWVACMGIGTGCKVHLKADELPSGKILARVSKHFTAVVDGVINDIYDCSREETRCVYGYYVKE